MKLDLRVVAAHIEWNANCIVEFDGRESERENSGSDAGMSKEGK